MDTEEIISVIPTSPVTNNFKSTFYRKRENNTLNFKTIKLYFETWENYYQPVAEVKQMIHNQFVEVGPQKSSRTQLTLPTIILVDVMLNVVMVMVVVVVVAAVVVAEAAVVKSFNLKQNLE